MLLGVQCEISVFPQPAPNLNEVNIAPRKDTFIDRYWTILHIQSVLYCGAQDKQVQGMTHSLGLVRCVRKAFTLDLGSNIASPAIVQVQTAFWVVTG